MTENVKEEIKIPQEKKLQSPLIEKNENKDENKNISEENKEFYLTNKTLASIKSISYVMNRKIRWILFFIFVIINLLMNFDHGTIPAATEQIRNHLFLSDSELGIFGSLVFIGVIIGSLISMTIINLFNRKYILMICLILCGLSLFIFTRTKSYILLCIDRVVIGIFQAFISIYLPLWCEQFGVEAKKTMMMALIQVAPPLGVLVGYIVTTILNMYLSYLPYYGDINDNERWVFSFYIQSFIIWGISICLLFFSDKYFNAKARRVPLEVEETLNNIEKKNNKNNNKKVKLSFFYEGNENFDELKENNSSQDLSEKDDEENEDNNKDDKNYQKEEMEELKDEENNQKDNFQNNEDIKEDEKDKNENKTNSQDSHNEKTIIKQNGKKTDNKEEKLSFLTKLKLIFTEPLFICCVLTMSVLFFIVTCVQYWSSDYMLLALDIKDETKRLYCFSIVCLTSPTCGLIIGGLIVDKIGGYSKKGSLIFSLIVAMLSGIPSILLPLVNSLILYAIFLWILLFLGSSILPTIQGITIACLPKDVQGSGNSFVIFFYNLVGYLPAPFIYGFLKDSFDDKNDPKKGSKVAQKVTTWITFLAGLFVGIATIIRFKKDKEYNEIMGRDTTKKIENNFENINNKDNNDNDKENDVDAIRPRESSLKPDYNENKNNENDIELNVKENNNIEEDILK